MYVLEIHKYATYILATFKKNLGLNYKEKNEEPQIDIFTMMFVFTCGIVISPWCPSVVLCISSKIQTKEMNDWYH